MGHDELVAIGGRLKALRLAEALLADKRKKHGYLLVEEELQLDEIKRLKKVANLELKKAVQEVQGRLPF